MGFSVGRKRSFVDRLRNMAAEMNAAESLSTDALAFAAGVCARVFFWKNAISFVTLRNWMGNQLS